MFTAEIIINKPVDKVWQVFTDSRSWAEWYGGAISRVDPGWQSDASIIWERGDESRIGEFKPLERVEMFSGGGVRTAWYFESRGAATRVSCWQDFSASRLAVTDANAVVAQIQGDLANLKRYVESGRQPRRDWINELKSSPLRWLLIAGALLLALVLICACFVLLLMIGTSPVS